MTMCLSLSYSIQRLNYFRQNSTSDHANHLPMQEDRLRRIPLGEQTTPCTCCTSHMWGTSDRQREKEQTKSYDSHGRELSRAHACIRPASECSLPLHQVIAKQNSYQPWFDNTEDMHKCQNPTDFENIFCELCDRRTEHSDFLEMCAGPQDIQNSWHG